MSEFSLAATAVPLQRLEFAWLADHSVELAVLRLDLLDPQLSGNKSFKLRPFLEEARQKVNGGLIGLGGAHSNHLHALAAAGQRLGLQTVGLLRGEPQDTPTVRDLQAFGMHLHWLGYGGYRQRHAQDFWTPWLAGYPGFLPIPEGGSTLAAALACAEIVELVEVGLSGLGWADFDGWWLAAGTGTTAAGLVLAEDGRRLVHIASAVPPGQGVARQIESLLREAGKPVAGYRLVDAARGGFGRVDAELARFMFECEEQSGMTLEPLYTAKALMSLRHDIEAGYVAAGSRLLFVHTGGLQGRRAMLERLQRLAE